ncbi:TauD/TfdA family dioxygenase [Pseudomonas sp. CFBP 13711]|uniref:condensation domain-containing protein n=1 Tax=unclassified Pseudomonas TaxID=196821 RepID=UPI001786F902|nr:MULTISPECIES: condensation domain-containing protein [unclassified Pseudomonas]MBD8708472.1 TauD/TfdA family dioxygenase [Pseudomonas sp. CFBP 13711]MBD8713914.1 TauD/TfdA family dioxygenase [Pseudomonas sp. CFBP 13715]
MSEGQPFLSAQARGPANAGQEGLWVVQSIGRAGTAYQEVLALNLEGALDIQRLEQAVDRVVRRHPSLRSCFVAGPQGLEQCVWSMGGPQMVAEPVAPGHLQGWMAHQQRLPFNLSVAPLFRVRLAVLGPNHHVVLIVVHHIIVDGWSLGVFERDLSAFYAAGPHAGLPELSTSPIDHARRERERAHTPAWREAQRFWSQYLAGIPRVAAQSGSQALTQALHLDGQATQALLAVARQLKVSAFALGFGAFAVAMSTLTERDDLVLATDFSGRTEPTYEPVIGLFVNQIPLRWSMSPGLTGASAAQQAQRLTREVLAHAHLPYPLIVEACQHAGGQLFEGKFVLHNMPRHPVHLEGLKVQVSGGQGADPKFPVLLELWEQGDGLSGSVTIDPSRSRLTPQLLAQRFHAVLESIVLTPQRPLGRMAPAPAAPAFVPSRRRVDVTADPVSITPSTVAPRPTLIECPSADVDLSRWAHKECDVIETHLRRSGAVLFRGFGLNSSDMFARAVKQLGGEPLPYVQRSTPRSEVEAGVYTSTEYPADQSIFFHSENAYATRWPARLFFFCETPAAEGGRTPLADCRAVLKQLPEMIRNAFERHGVIYRRRFRPGLGLSWQQVFAVDDLDTLERQYVQQGYRFSRGSHNELVADLAVPAVVTHPDTGEVAWFNHAALFHPAALAEALGEVAAGQDVSQLQAMETLLGDGSAIPAEWIAQIRRAYVAASFAFDWQQGDLLMLDNRLTAHGREPFTAPRRILVAMTHAQRHQPLLKEF